MLKFIICDDNEQVCENVTNIINSTLMPLDLEYRINKFNSFDSEFQKIINDSSDEKIYILDIELPKYLV